MKKTIYHGSDHIIEKPQYGYGKPYNDYGVGFYCTENPNMAKEWGVSIDHKDVYKRQALAEGKGVHREVESEGSRMSAEKTLAGKLPNRRIEII